jgi:hypothetical protein
MHQAFDYTLSHHPIMDVSSITFVPTLNYLLTSSYLHPAGGMTAHTDATPTSPLLFHIKDNSVITTATHEPSLLLLYVHDNPAIMTALNNKISFFFLSKQSSNYNLKSLAASLSRQLSNYDDNSRKSLDAFLLRQFSNYDSDTCRLVTPVDS